MNISNLVSWQYFTFSIDVDEPVMNLTAWVDPWIVNVTDVVTIHVNMSWGSRYAYWKT